MMMQLLSVVAAAVAVRGLKVGDAPPPAAGHLLGTRSVLAHGVVSANGLGNDPEFTNTLGEVFHVTTPGSYNLIGLPKDYTSAYDAELVVDATLEDLGTGACDDLLIRSVKIQGTKLGSEASCLEFTVDSDVFNDTAAIGLNVTKRGVPVTSGKRSPEEFVATYPACTLTRPRANISAPLRTSYRKRTKLFTATCTLAGGENVITVTWSTVWRGLDKTATPMTPIYMNDLEVFVSGVGSDPAGLLGQMDHASVSAMVPGCPKKQPVNGPYQTVAAGGTSTTAAAGGGY